MPRISVEKIAQNLEFKILNEENSPKGHLIIGAIDEKHLVLFRQYYLSSPKNVFESLKTATEKFPKTYDIESAVFYQDFVYFACLGGTISITRAGKTVEILNAPKGHAKVLSGKFLPGDVYYFSKNFVIHLAKEPQPELPPQAVTAVPVATTTISPIRAKIVNLIDKILKILPEQKIFVKDEMILLESRRKRKTIFVVGTILLLLLLASIGFGIKSRANRLALSQYSTQLQTAQHNLDEAKSLSSVSAPRARELILEARDEAQAIKDKGVKDPKLDQLIADIQSAIGSVAGIYQEDLNLYLDLSLISSGFSGDNIAASDNRMAVLDKNGKKLVSIATDTKKTEVVAGPDVMPNATSLAIYADRNFVSASDGIWEVGDKADNVIKNEWGQNILPFAYTGNVYILDKDNSVVWRYQGDGGTFGPKGNWFGAGIKPDLSGIISWTIDGNIWMLDSTGNILRFSGGSPINFSPKGLDKDLSGVDIYTDQDSKYLYILDTQNSRVLVLDKDGNYKAQYLSDQIKNTKKIIVSESNQKIILLQGDKLYSLDIKHL